MIRIGNKELAGAGIGKRSLAMIAKGGRVIWEAVSSCFGSGTWRGDRPWKGTDSWKNF